MTPGFGSLNSPAPPSVLLGVAALPQKALPGADRLPKCQAQLTLEGAASAGAVPGLPPQTDWGRALPSSPFLSHPVMGQPAGWKVTSLAIQKRNVQSIPQA